MRVPSFYDQIVVLEMYVGGVKIFVLLTVLFQYRIEWQVDTLAFPRRPYPGDHFDLEI